MHRREGSPTPLISSGATLARAEPPWISREARHDRRTRERELAHRRASDPRRCGRASSRGCASEIPRGVPRSAGRSTLLQNVYISIIACCTAIVIIITITTAAAAAATTTVFIIFLMCHATHRSLLMSPLRSSGMSRAGPRSADWTKAQSPAPNQHIFMHAHNPCFHACAEHMFSCMRTTHVLHAHSLCCFHACTQPCCVHTCTCQWQVFRAFHTRHACHACASLPPDRLRHPGGSGPGFACPVLVRFFRQFHSVPETRPGSGLETGPESRSSRTAGRARAGPDSARVHVHVSSCGQPSFAYTRARALFTRTRELHLHAPHTSPACQALPSTRFAIVNARTQEAV